MNRKALSLALVGWGGLVCGCDTSRPELGAIVQNVSTAEGTAVERALANLVQGGAATLPLIEAGMPRATPAGRHNLVVAIRRLGLAESAPLLGQIAAYDADGRVAREAWETLGRWAAARDLRGDAARRALIKVDEIRGSRFDVAPVAESLPSVR